MLNPTRSLYYELDARDLEELIRRALYRPHYDLRAVEGWSNDSTHVLDVDCEYSPREHREALSLLADQSVENDWECGAALCLQELVYREVLPPGKYLIFVCY